MGEDGNISSKNSDHLMLMAQHAMLNAAHGGHNALAAANCKLGPSQFGDEQQPQHSFEPASTFLGTRLQTPLHMLAHVLSFALHLVHSLW